MPWQLLVQAGQRYLRRRFRRDIVAEGRESLADWLKHYGPDLRRSLIHVIIGYVLFLALGFIGAPYLYRLFRPEITLYILEPTDGFKVYFLLSNIIAFAALTPLVVREVLFLYAAVTGRPFHGFRYVLIAFFLFILGLFFGLFVFFPFLFRFTLTLAQSFHIEPYYSVQRYFSFMIGLALPMAFFFETPLIMYTLARIGWVKPVVYRRYRKYAYFFLYVMSSMMTPPDIIAHLSGAVPLILLYEAGIFSTRFFDRSSHSSEHAPKRDETSSPDDAGSPPLS